MRFDGYNLIMKKKEEKKTGKHVTSIKVMDR